MDNNIRKLRTEKGLTQKELGVILNVSARSVGFYESGERDPDTVTLKKLADYFGVSIDYILGRSEENVMTFSSEPKTQAFHLSEDVSELSLEEIEQIDDYIRFIKSKHKK
jgi:transcriptional regulator with XRE-family HTH domain